LYRWIKYLEGAIFGEEDQFKRALACCYSLREVSFVNYAYACYLVKNGRHVEAATSNFVLQDFSSFEEVVHLRYLRTLYDLIGGPAPS
jgi:hypothetical protein